jgi:4-diphosphocytidyl-2-C-methyl-D-erythritol kinase
LRNFAESFALFAFRFLLSMSDSTLILPAFAKINLSLRVIGKRPDGYHEIDTVLQTISLHDTIRLTTTETPEIILSCDDRSLPAGADNLVYRAASALQVRFSPGKGARIRLEKRIPVQAGLGGGSSDAAVTLLGLARLWQTTATPVDLLEIARELGADVPFFFLGGTARATGTGSDLRPLGDALDRFLIVLKPNAGIPTRDAYGSLNAPSLKSTGTSALTSAGAKTILSSSEQGENSDRFDLKALQNDFESVAFQLAPEIERAKKALMIAGAEAVLLAGSGSALFGFFDNGDAQARAIQMIELEAGWRVFPCRTVGRDSYRIAIGEGAKSPQMLLADVEGR